MTRAIFCIFANLALISSALAEPTTAPATEPLDQAGLERRFKENLTGAVFVGRFSDDAHPDAASGEERYTLQKVSKIPFTERWLFASRVQFGQKDVLVPLTIPVRWAGDTPVISVTDMNIPGLGTYTARVMVYGDHYAGTWSGTTHGGQMWGRIEHPATAPATQPAP